jgi:hypothetical protein
MKVLYIMGMTRSGSTLLDRILGAIYGFFSLGEFYTVWDQYVIGNRLCGCGVPFKECDVWRAIFDAAYGGFENSEAKEMSRIRNALFRTRQLPYLFMPSYRSWLNKKIPAYLDSLDKLYRAVVTTTSSKVVVDSSKLPTYAEGLHLIPSIDLFIVHLIRDPRGVAYSWQKVKKGIDGTAMNRMNPAVTAAIWNTCNLTSEVMRRRNGVPYLCIHYEDFIRQPRATVQQILKLVGESTAATPFVSDHEVELGITHNVEGNPDRFQSGVVRLRVDDGWRDKLKPGHRRIVTALTWPLMKRYGYPVGGKGILR